MTELATERVPKKLACGETFVPKSRYIDTEFLHLEFKRLFAQVWQPACREEEIPNAGCFYECTIGRQSIAVVRQKDGSVKAFHNTCAHRGMKIVRGSGCSRDKDLRCEFHGWRYGLDGRSSFVPCRDEFAPRPRQQWGLRPVAVGDLGWLGVREHGRQPPGSARMARPATDRAGAVSPAGHALPLAQAHILTGQLEDSHRRLHRGLPHAGHPSADNAIGGRPAAVG